MSIVIDRVKEALTNGGKVRGFRKSIFNADNSLKGHARQMFELLASDLKELSAAAAKSSPDDEVVQAQTKGAAFWVASSPDTVVTILADDAFHLVELAEKGSPPVPSEV